jgi:hypothetical protein
MIAERTCKSCGETFQTPRPEKAFCSPWCKRNAMRAAFASRLPPQQCEACGTTFQPDRRGAKFCSGKCYHQSRANGFACEAV